MTQEPKHTPTPWFKVGQTVQAKPPKGWKSTPQHPKYVVVQTGLYTSPDREIAEANADHIVRCVNSHDALVNNLEEIAFITNNPDYPNDKERLEAAVNIAKHAIESLKKAGAK